MSSLFYGLEIAKSGLYASQYALNVTGHNIANADTEGYTRQRLDATAKDYAKGVQLLATTELAYIGQGVSIDSVTQIRDSFLDKQFRDESSEAGYWSKLTTGMEDLEIMFDELSDSSISNTLIDFFGSFQDLSNNPTDYEVRVEVMSKGLQLTSTLNYYYEKLEAQQKVYDESVSTLVAQVNQIAENISKLNKNIRLFETSGEKANDLRDQRNILIDELSSIIDIEYSETDANGLVIQIDGRDLVSNTTVNELSVTQTSMNNITGTSDLNQVVWASDSASVAINSGQLKGILQLRDGNSQDAYGVPYLANELNKLASALVSEVNAVHTQGYSIPCTENGDVSTTGINFFDDLGGATPITAGNINLSSEILLTANNIAASDALVSDVTLQHGNNINALALVDLFNSGSIPGIESFQGFLTSTVSNLGIAVEYDKNMQEMQAEMLANKENSRLSISGVSVDEELTNLVKYQHAYSAASRVITTIDEMLDKLINSTGMVGR